MTRIEPFKMNNLKSFTRNIRKSEIYNFKDVVRRSSQSNKFFEQEKEIENEKQRDAMFKEGGSNLNLLKAFASTKNTFKELHRYNPFTVTTERLRMWKERKLLEADLMDQKFRVERHRVLGNDLAAAYFIVYRGGRVKFMGQPNWIVKEKNVELTTLPKIFEEGWLLEAVDASGLALRYEAFENLKELSELTTLIVRDSPHLDDWCVDRISGEFRDSLQYLDLSGCHKVTERSLSCLSRCKNLKTLILTDIVKTRSFEFSCLLLEDVMPNLTIEGVKYINATEEPQDNKT